MDEDVVRSSDTGILNPILSYGCIARRRGPCRLTYWAVASAAGSVRAGSGKVQVHGRRKLSVTPEAASALSLSEAGVADARVKRSAKRASTEKRKKRILKSASGHMVSVRSEGGFQDTH